MVKNASKAPAVQHIKKVQSGRIARRGKIGGKPYKRMQAVQERKAVKLGQALYRTIKMYVAPAANTFLVSKGKVCIGNVNIDFQSIVNVIKDEVKADPNFVPISRKQLDKISIARNDIDHDDLSSLYKSSNKHFSVLKNLCACLGDTDAADQVQRMWDLVKRGKYRDALKFSFHFTTDYDDHVAYCLSDIIYGVIDKYLVGAMWQFRDNTEIGDPPIDAYANLKFFISKQSADVDYLAQGGVDRDDQNTLRLCMDARLRNRHGGHTDTFSGWHDYLDAIIRFLRVLNDPDGAQEVEKIRNKLITARTNNTEVSSAIFPSLF